MRTPSLNRNDWRQLALELLIVSVGVLIALLVNQWNENRIDAGLERQYLSRLSQDVAADREGLQDLSEALKTKMSALRSVQQLTSDAIEEAAASGDLATTLIEAQAAGFGVLKGVSTTFDDLSSSGNLSLIRSPKVRSQIVAYYQAWRFNADRVQARKSAFPHLIYSILPPEAYSADVYFDAPATDASVKIDPDVVRRAILSEEGQRQTRSEINYARFFAGVVQDLIQESQKLQSLLTEHTQ